MGTRNLTCVIKDGEYRIAQYCQWDGYPEGQGSTILKFLQNKMDRKKFETALKYTQWITEEEHTKLWESFGADGSGFVDMTIADAFKEVHPQLDRDMGAGVLEFVQESDIDFPIVLQDSVDFAKDGLFCEWVYVIDLDNDKLEVYGGYNEKEVQGASRFGADMVDEDTTPANANAVYDLNDLPTQEQFEKDLAEPCEDELEKADVDIFLHEMLSTLVKEDQLEMSLHVANYIQANMDDFLEAINEE